MKEGVYSSFFTTRTVTYGNITRDYFYRIDKSQQHYQREHLHIPLHQQDFSYDFGLCAIKLDYVMV